MKKLFTVLLMLASFASFAQKDSTKADTTKKPEVKQKVFALILTEQEFATLWNIVSAADIKPSALAQYKSFLRSRMDLLADEKPKKVEKKK